MIAALLLAAPLVVSGGVVSYSLDLPSEDWHMQMEGSASVLKGPGDLVMRPQPASARGGKAVEALLQALVARTQAGTLTHEPRLSREEDLETAVGTVFKSNDFRVFAVAASKDVAMEIVASTKDRSRLAGLALAVHRVLRTVRPQPPEPPPPSKGLKKPP